MIFIALCFYQQQLAVTIHETKSADSDFPYCKERLPT